MYTREVYDTRKWEWVEWDIVIFMNIYFIDAECMYNLNNASIVWKTWKNGLSVTAAEMLIVYSTTSIKILLAGEHNNYDIIYPNNIRYTARRAVS